MEHGPREGRAHAGRRLTFVMSAVRADKPLIPKLNYTDRQTARARPYLPTISIDHVILTSSEVYPLCHPWRYIDYLNLLTQLSSLMD